MLIINGKQVMVSPLTVQIGKPSKAEKPKMGSEDPAKQEASATKAEEPKKMSEVEQKPKETAALDHSKKTGKPKKRRIHGVETRHAGRR